MRRSPGRDLLAGLTVAVVALPLALGFGVTSGLGAAGRAGHRGGRRAVAAVFGGSNLQVSGPTGAMTVVLVPIVHEYGADGVLTVGLLAGVMLIALALLRAGRYVRYVPAPVVEGFTVGIAAVIVLQQVPAALGVAGAHGGQGAGRWPREAVARLRRARPDWAAIAAGARRGGADAARRAGGVPGVPFSLVGVAAATVLAGLARARTCARIGRLPASLPAASLGFLDLGACRRAAAGAAVAVAALAALECLLSATVADG